MSEYFETTALACSSHPNILLLRSFQTCLSIRAYSTAYRPIDTRDEHKGRIGPARLGPARLEGRAGPKVNQGRAGPSRWSWRAGPGRAGGREGPGRLSGRGGFFVQLHDFEKKVLSKMARTCNNSLKAMPKGSILMPFFEIPDFVTNIAVF